MATNSTDVATRTNRGATARRHVVLGAVEGGPAGAAVAATGKRRASSSAASSEASGARPTRSARAGRASTGYARKRGQAFALKSLSGPASGALFAEYFGGAFIITIELFTKAPTEGYSTVMSRVLIRLTALTSLFFVLFLLSGSKRGGQFAIWFGLLVDLGIVFNAARSQTFSTLSDEISGQGTGISLDSVTSSLDVPHPQQMSLPDE